MQAPQPMSKQATTRSPGLKFFTSGPTLSTMPMNCGAEKRVIRIEKWLGSNYTLVFAADIPGHVVFIFQAMCFSHACRAHTCISHARQAEDGMMLEGSHNSKNQLW